MELLHFNGPVWRPPFEAQSQLLQVTAGCSHHRCKFCALYHDTAFRLSPLSEIEADLRTITEYQPRARRLFLTGANPFVLSYDRLFELAVLFRKYLRHLVSWGCFARITDIAAKSVEELKALHHLGLDDLSIGTESGDDATLARMDKGYAAADILRECAKLEEAGIRYHLTYLVGLAGHGEGKRNARNTARVFNRLHPVTLNFVSLTLFPESELYAEMRTGAYVPASEQERLKELIQLFSLLTCQTTVLGNTVSNPVPFVGLLPKEKLRLIRELEQALDRWSEMSLQDYRRGISSL